MIFKKINITLIIDAIWRISSVNNLAHEINLSKASSDDSHSVFESWINTLGFQLRQSKAFVEKLIILSIFIKLNTNG